MQIIVIFMTIPVVGIFLPVYFTAGQEYQRGANQLDYTCAITEVPVPIARAWSNVQKVDLSIKNATSFINQLAARSKRPVRFRADRNLPPVRPGPFAAAAVSEYLAYQRCACNQVRPLCSCCPAAWHSRCGARAWFQNCDFYSVLQIASLVFDDPGSWDCDTGPNPSDGGSRNSSTFYNDLLATFLGNQGDQLMPPPAPPSPPHPPGWVNPSPAPSSSDDVPPDYASLDEELDDSDYMDAYYELLSYTEGEEASPAPAPAPTPAALSNPGAAPRASTAPPSSAGRRHLAQSVVVSPPNRVPQPTVFNAISYNVTDPKLRAAHDQRLAGYMGLRVSVSKVDPQVKLKHSVQC